MDRQFKFDIVITSGGFDPLHIGHLEYLYKAKGLGRQHLCIVNSDEFLMNKKGYVFMPQEERICIIRSLTCVDNTYKGSKDEHSVTHILKRLRRLYPTQSICFAKGGDRNKDNIPEFPFLEKLNITLIDGLGSKIKSSSEMVKRSFNNG